MLIQRFQMVLIKREACKKLENPSQYTPIYVNTIDKKIAIEDI